ncbi:hypothetical protein [Deinococcus reticulitermitis]|uniref:hypothetical protein n=1 Tax=Deinococcus reticulitermitis TaxID=856736 RepID=UPI0011606982|nr:hypothetical protein [Deinococcus reticulitermitis]
MTERRELRGYETASDLAKKSKEVAEQLRDPQMSAFSQQTLSRLEGDKTGELIANARPRIQRMLSYLLGWSAEEFEMNVGVGIPAVPHFSNTSPLSASSPPTPDIPEGLLEAGERFASIDPLIAHPKVQAMLARQGNFGGRGPETAREWWSYFESVRRYIEVDE